MSAAASPVVPAPLSEEKVREWLATAAPAMTSSLDEYCPAEFTLLAKGYLQLVSTKRGFNPFGTGLSAAQSIHNAAVIYEDEPVEVRRRVLDELDRAWLHGQRRTSWRRDESADAILAVLRPAVPVMGAALRQRYELPADMEAVVARLEVSASDPAPWPDLRALLKAYQEQRRALDRIGNALEAVRYVPGDHPVVPIKHDAFVKTVDAALNQKSDEQ